MAEIDRKKVVKGLEYCAFGFSDICYGKECPYYKSHDCTDELKNDIFALLKEPEEQKRKWLQNIADNQLSIGGVNHLTEYEQGKWEGLQIALEILTEERQR